MFSYYLTYYVSHPFHFNAKSLQCKFMKKAACQVLYKMKYLIIWASILRIIVLIPADTDTKTAEDLIRTVFFTDGDVGCYWFATEKCLVLKWFLSAARIRTCTLSLTYIHTWVSRDLHTVHFRYEEMSI